MSIRYALVFGLSMSGAALAQGTPAPAPESLQIFFDVGSSTLRTQDLAVLDRAARTYRDGNPIVMIVSGSSDASGTPDLNLRLSQLRAQAVLRGLVARGIPVAKFQLLAKGETDPAVPTAPGTAEPRNRRVEISWR